MEDKEKKKVIWIDKHIDNEENSYTYSELENSLPDHDIIKSHSIKETFEYIKKNYEKFKFKLFYVIVSGSLSEKFFEKYIKMTHEMNILCATIIYCSEKNKKLYEKKPYFLDNFLNPGKVVDSSYYLIEYIKSVECQYYKDPNMIDVQKIKNEINQEKNTYEKAEFAAEFTHVEDIGTMAYPILVSKHINCTLIEQNDLELMQKMNIKEYPKLKHLFKPSEEKNFFVPYHILAKYYLSIYTYESSFYGNMNNDLKKKEFDKHRTFIYLMYHGLNKGIFKSYSKSNLYRGGTLSQEEFNSLSEKLEKQKNSTSSTNKVFFYSRKFLSFSKLEEVANNYIQTAIFSEYKGVYVRIIVEGIDSKNKEEKGKVEETDNKSEFFVSNIDINKMDVSAFSNEEEVLFLPLSCFEVIGIEDEDFYGYNIKVIKLNYLNKYCEEIEKNLEMLSEEKNQEKIEKFIKDGMNSKYSKGIFKYLTNKVNNNYTKELTNKLNMEIKYQAPLYVHYNKSNPMGKKIILKEEYLTKYMEIDKAKVLLENAEKLIDVLNTELQSFQFGSYNGKSCIAFFDTNGKLQYLKGENVCHICSVDKNMDGFVSNSEPVKLRGLKMGKVMKSITKNYKNCKEEDFCNEKMGKKFISKDNKNAYKQSGAVEANMVGNIIGHFFANFDQFKKLDFSHKCQMVMEYSIPLAANVLIKTLGNTIPGTIFRLGFFAINIVNIFRSAYEVFDSDVLSTLEKIEIVTKKALIIGADIGIGVGGQLLGMKIATCIGIAAGPGAIIIGAVVGLIFGYAAGRLIKYFSEKSINDEMVFFSDSMYFQYIPMKFRQYIIPTLKWKNLNLSAKSLAIELIVDEDGQNPNWLVINIPAKLKEFNEVTKEGYTIIEYKGIPINAFSACFLLYVFNVKEIKYKDFKNMKNGLKEGEKLRKSLINFKILLCS